MLSAAYSLWPNTVKDYLHVTFVSLSMEFDCLTFGFIPMSGLLVMNYFTVLKLYILVKLETLLIFSWNVTQTNGLLQYRENFKLSLYIFGEVAPGPSFTKLPRTLKWSHCSSTKNPLHHVGGIYIFLKKHCSHMLFFWREWNRNNKTSVDIHTFKRLPT